VTWSKTRDLSRFALTTSAPNLVAASDNFGNDEVSVCPRRKARYTAS
jgi:hypothetical protein